MAAAQNELIDGVLRVFVHLLGMHHDQGIDVLVDGLQRIRVERAHFELLGDFLVGRPRLAHLPRGLVEAHGHRQFRHETDRRFLGHGELVDQLGHVVFQEGFLVRLEERDVGFAIRGIGADEAKEHLVAGLAHGHGLQTGGGGAVFVFGERQGVDHLEHDLALGTRRHLGEQFAHALVVGAQLREILRCLVRIVEREVNGLVEAADDIFGTVRQGIQMTLCEIDADAAEQHIAHHHHGNEADGEEHESTAGEGFAIEHGGGLLSRLS